MRKPLVAGLLAVISFLGMATVAPPARADSGPGRFTFNASPGPVKKGAYVTLSGINTKLYFDTNVLFFFKADGSTVWVYQNYVRVKKGKYSKRQAQNHSGTWRATAACECDSIGAPSLTDHVSVRGTQLPGVVNGCSYSKPYYVSYKPSTIDISCTTYWGYTSVKWLRLTMTSAKATAISHSNDCDPACAGGRYHTERVTLTFSRVRVHHGALTFTKITEHPSGYSYGMYPADY